MKVVLFGASGKVGAPILQELSDRGHEVLAVARNADRVPAGLPGVEVRSGDAFSAAFVREVLSGAAAVIVSVAMRDDDQRGRDDRTPVQLIRTVSNIAEQVGIRFLTMGGAGSLEVAPGVQLVDTPAFPEVAKPESEGFRDALIHLRTQAPDTLDWVMLSPPVQIEPESPRTGVYRTSADSLVTDDEGKSRISAADLAVAMVDELEHPAHLRARFAVGY